MKNMKINIEMSKEPAKSPVSGMGDEAMMAEDEALMEAAPKGKFTPKGLAPLVKAANMLLPLFGQTADYPAISGELAQLPTDFFRVLSMFKAAVDDAIAEEVIGQEMAIDFNSIKDDTSLMLLSGKIQQLAKDKAFKQFLKEPPKGETVASEAGEEGGMPEEEMSTDNADQLMMGRM